MNTQDLAVQAPDRIHGHTTNNRQAFVPLSCTQQCTWALSKSLGSHFLCIWGSNPFVRQCNEYFLAAGRPYLSAVILKKSEMFKLAWKSMVISRRGAIWIPLRKISSLLANCDARHSHTVSATANAILETSFCGGTSLPQPCSKVSTPTLGVSTVKSNSIWVWVQFNW